MNQDFQDILDGLPAKTSRSRLEPYRGLIEELRRRGRTYKEIVQILEEKCQLRTAVSTVNDFMRHTSPTKENSSKSTKPVFAGPTDPSPATADTARSRNRMEQQKPAPEEIEQRIAALEQRAVVIEAVPKLFEYDPDEPLHLLPKTEKSRI